jgi:hypothetical protein
MDAKPVKRRRGQTVHPVPLWLLRAGSDPDVNPNPVTPPMRPAALTVLFCLALPAAAAPALGDAAIVAASRLAEQANYSWSTFITNDANNGQIHFEGQAIRGGYTGFSVRNLPDILRNRGVLRDAEGASQIYFRNGRCVILTDQDWLAPDELPPAPSVGRNPSPNARGGRGRGAAPSSVPTRIEDYTFDLRHPHEDLDLIIGSYTTLRPAADSFTGELTSAGAALFLSFFAQTKVEVRRAAGSFHCWIENGVVVRYEVMITATVNVVGDRNPLPVTCTITTEIHDIGTTRLNVPQAVRLKLG